MQPLNPIERGIRGVVNPKFQHKDNKGTRVPGWEEVNFSKLAKHLKLDQRWVREGITGREDGITLRYLLQAAELLGLSMAEIGARIDYTRSVDSMLKAEGKTRMEAHAMLEGRLTTGQKYRADNLAKKPTAEFRYPSTDARPGMRDYFPRNS